MSEHSWQLVLDSKIQGNTDFLQLKFNTSSILKYLLSAFDNKAFMWHHAQALQQLTVQLALKQKAFIIV